jgi:hypothetical protein
MQSRLVSSVVDAARENPIGAALVGMGLVWFFTGDRALRLGAQAPAVASRVASAGGLAIADVARSTGEAIGSASQSVARASSSAAQQAASAAHQAADVVATAATRTGDVVRSGADGAGDATRSMGETLRSTSSRSTQAVAEVAKSVRSQFGQMLHEQPLLLAAGAFAVGAAMAASLPLTETEERVLGDAADSAMQFATGGQSDSVGDRLQNAVAAAKEEARRQGFTPDGLKREAAELRERVTSTISGVTGASSPPV